LPVVSVSANRQSCANLPQILGTPVNLHLPARRTDSRFTGRFDESGCKHFAAWMAARMSARMGGRDEAKTVGKTGARCSVDAS
jgi:hypothetical protein